MPLHVKKKKSDLLHRNAASCCSSKETRNSDGASLSVRPTGALHDAVNQMEGALNFLFCGSEGDVMERLHANVNRFAFGRQQTYAFHWFEHIRKVLVRAELTAVLCVFFFQRR